MVIRINALQIVQFWDVIKYSLQQTDRIGADQTEEAFNLIFAQLMCDKAQCFIKYKDGQICAVMITEVIESKLSGERSFKLRSLYAFKPFDLNEWEGYFGVLLKVAKSEKCSKILFDSKHPKIIQVAKELNFKTLHTTMEYTIGD